MQPRGVRDLAGKLTCEPKTGMSHFDPTTDITFRRSSMKRRVHFNRGEIIGVKFQPPGLRQIRRIKNITPVLKAPRTRADANFLLITKVQVKLQG
jgi:hypothetical protein